MYSQLSNLSKLWFCGGKNTLSHILGLLGKVLNLSQLMKICCLAVKFEGKYKNSNNNNDDYDNNKNDNDSMQFIINIIITTVTIITIITLTITFFLFLFLLCPAGSSMSQPPWAKCTPGHHKPQPVWHGNSSFLIFLSRRVKKNPVSSRSLQLLSS